MTSYSGYRTHIVIAGKRNVGKSSTINALVGQDVAIVSEYPGTTTDPVYKIMELAPLGPVTIIDTPGIDDQGSIGELRVSRAKRAFYKADIAILVVDDQPSEYEQFIAEQFANMKIPYIIAVNKIDQAQQRLADGYFELFHVPVIELSAKTGEGIEELKQAVAENLPPIDDIPYLPDGVSAGDFVVMVVPIDLGAPKGRLIMPQVVAIRETIDRESVAMVVKERELRYALDNLAVKPKLVITDSQAIMKVAADVPEDILLTTFSVLEARHKGDLRILTESVAAVEDLDDGDLVVIMEGCSHRPLTEDIGRIKIPRWLTNHTGKSLQFKIIPGKEVIEPEDIEQAKVVVHCGGCTLTRAMMTRRIRSVARLGVPIVNYGILISYLHGVLPRVIQPFDEVADLAANRN